jgi:hypothetical protein
VSRCAARLGAPALAILCALASLACDDPESRRLLVARSLYDRYCAECHGLSVSGPEPVRDLGFEVPDLRRLDTPLDRERLAAYIDGRHDVRDDGEEMPVWGERMYRHLPDTVEVEEMKAGAVTLILDYLETVQERP